MPVKKRFLKSKPVVKVTFEVHPPATRDAEQIFLLGDFAEWQPIELTKFKNGKFKATVDIPTDQQTEFQYKFRLVKADGEEYFDNDWDADGYRANEYGDENSLLLVSEAS